MRFATCLAACAAAALAAAAYADPVMDAANAQLAAAQAAILAFYPPDAKAKGVEGEATLDCRRTPHGALTACTLAAETPSGAGFGDAALAIAQRSRDDPTVAAPPDAVDTPHPITFSFRLSPPGIEPNVLLPQVIQPLGWLGVPPPGPRLRYYPERAAQMNIAGRVVLDCYVDDEGRASLCAIVAEAPPGWEFGKAALGLAQMMNFKHKPAHGAQPPPYVRGRRVFPLDFRPPSS